MKFPLPASARRAAVLLAGCAALATVPTFAQVVKPSVVVFPFSKPDAVDPTIADSTLNGVRSRLLAGAQYEVVTFYARSPLVTRAVESNAITRDQAAGPFDATSSTAVAKALGADYALTGNIEDYTYDAAAHTGTMTLTLTLLAASDAHPVKTAVVTGTATDATLAEDAVARAAADATAAKATAQILGTTPTAGPAPTAGTVPRANPTSIPTTPQTTGIPVENSGHKKKGGGGLLVLGGIALIALIAAGGHGGGGGGGSTGGPPTFPL